MTQKCVSLVMRNFYWLTILALFSCTSSIDGAGKHGASPEADASIPGMIPLQCEELLQKSQAWGYTPGEVWSLQSEEQATDMADFFSRFTFVPAPTALFYQEWMTQPASSSEDAAKDRMERFTKAQICDVPLASTFLQGLVRYKWKKEQKDLIRKSLLSFVLNQQARVAPLAVRAMVLDVMEKSYKQGLLRLTQANFSKVRAQIEKAWQMNEKSEALMLATELATLRELKISDEIRHSISQMLPLP